MTSSKQGVPTLVITGLRGLELETVWAASQSLDHLPCAGQPSRDREVGLRHRILRRRTGDQQQHLQHFFQEPAIAV